MEMRIANSGSSCEVIFSGQFTFQDNQAFKTVLEVAEETHIQSIVLDFTAVTFIDSSVLGMVMILRNNALTRGQSVSIRGANGQVEKVMRMSQFDTKFTMI